MIKEFVFTIGLPGCGKSSYINKNYNSYGFFPYVTNMNCLDNAFNVNDNIVVSADELKPSFKGYTPENAYIVHEESVQYAKTAVLYLVDSNICYNRVIMDGGAINNHYTKSIIEYIREHNPDCLIKALFFDTPVEICIKRIENRERKVPIESIYDKNQKIIACINRYREMVDEFVRIDYFTNKYIILDMDGTIAGYSKVRFDEDGNADFVNGELFRHLRPNNHVIDFVRENYDMNNVYICTACANSIAWNEKCEWLDKYFPEIPITNRFWCGNKDYKYVFIKQLAEHMGWKRNEMVLIDDYHPTIDKCKNANINCLHPSNIEALIDPYAVFS